MFRSQSLVAVGVGLVRSGTAFVVPAGVSALRLFSAAVARQSPQSSHSKSLPRAHHGAGCRCCGCAARASARVGGLRMLSSTAPAYGEADTSSGPAEPIKLYIGNHGWDTSNEQLQEEFAAFGSPEECYVVMDRSTGESRGFGFVTYHSMEEAKQAVAGMNGKELDGRRIKVDISSPRGHSLQQSHRAASSTSATLATTHQLRTSSTSSHSTASSQT